MATMADTLQSPAGVHCLMTKSISVIYRVQVSITIDISVPCELNTQGRGYAFLSTHLNFSRIFVTSDRIVLVS